MLKKFFAIESLLLAVLVQFSFAAWDGSAQKPQRVVVNDTNYYEITSPEELIGYLDSILPFTNDIYNENAYLKNDIVFGEDTSKLCTKVWQRVGAGNFLSKFDGRGHTIYGLNATNSLFVRIGQSDGEVRNLNIANSSIGSDTAYATGAVADFAHTLIQNVNVYNTDVRAMGYAGGIVGNVIWYSEEKGAHILNSNVVGGSVHAGVYVGGIVGYMLGTVKNSTSSARVYTLNYDSLMITPDVSRYVGGIAGYISSRDSRTLENCVNYGNVEVNETVYALYAGGIAGFVEGGAHHLENYGNVFVKQFSPVSGSQLRPVNTYSYVGGAIGYLEAYRTDDSTFNLTNRGHVVADINSLVEKGSLYAGGAIGYLNSVGVSNLMNLGAVEAKGRGRFMSVMAGGLLGQGRANTYTDQFSRFMNWGDVYADGTYETYVGGIMGYLNNGFSEQSSLRESFNYGDVTGTVADTTSMVYYLVAGGIVGYDDGCMVSDVYNRGSVKALGTLPDASSYVGGIFGLQRYVSYYVKNGYSAADSLQGDVVGGVAGYLLDGGIPVNTYFDVTLIDTNGIGLDYYERDLPEFGKTTAELKTAEMTSLLNTENGTVEARNLWVFHGDYPVFYFDTLVIADSIPSGDSTVVTDSIPSGDSTVVTDSIPTGDSTVVTDSIPSGDSTVVTDSIPSGDSTVVTDSIPSGDSTVVTDSIPSGDSTVVTDSLPDNPDQPLVLPKLATRMMQVEVSARTILVKGLAERQPVMLFDMHGRLVKSVRFHGTAVNLTVPMAGRYIVRSGRNSRLVNVR